MEEKKSQPKITTLNKFQQIFENSVEWSKIEYRLRMSYANVSIGVRKIYSVVNNIMEGKFMSKHGDKVQLDFIINSSQVGASNEQLTAISQKGFTEVMQLNYGQLDLNKVLKKQDQSYEVMVCRVCIGQTYIFPAKNSTQLVPSQEKPEGMTKEFDSLFMYDEGQVTKEFRQKYVIYNANENILPMYIVHFTVNEGKYKELRERIICELCNDDIAKKYCETEDAYFCISCDSSHHSNRLGYKHRRLDITDKPKTVGTCPVHISIKLDLFCTECNRPLCVNCKIKGDHSSGEMLMHNLIRVTERYHESSKLLREPDALLDKKKKTLMGLVTAAETRLKDINRKNNQIQQKLTEIMQKALKKLQSVTKLKMSELMSDHIELKRQLDQIQWMDRFIKYQFEVLSPDDFLYSWERYTMFKKNAIANSFTPTKVLANMRIEGTIDITTDEEVNRSQKPVDISYNPLARKKEEDNNSYLIKNRINVEQIDSEQTAVKSKNNLLNLSILKHL